MTTESSRNRRIGGLVAAALAGASITLAMVSPWQAGAAPGDDDATFVPITACRLTDTRPGINRVGDNEPFGPTETKTLQATGTNGECSGIPATAIGLSMNVTALGATQQSFLTFWGGGPLPLAASLNPSPDQPPIPNAVTTDLSSTGTFNVYNDRGTVDVVIDVNGYYTPESLTALQSQVNTLIDDMARLETLLDQANGSIAGVDADVAALDNDLASTDATVAAIDAREPFSTSITSTGTLVNGMAATSVLSLELTAPADGSFSVTSTVSVADTLPDIIVSCSIGTSTTLDTNYEQRHSDSEGGKSGQLAGTREFAVTDGQVINVQLVCKRSNIASFAVVVDPVLTAIFTPSP